MMLLEYPPFLAMKIRMPENCTIRLQHMPSRHSDSRFFFISSTKTDATSSSTMSTNSME